MHGMVRAHGSFDELDDVSAGIALIEKQAPRRQRRKRSQDIRFWCVELRDPSVVGRTHSIMLRHRHEPTHSVRNRQVANAQKLYPQIYLNGYFHFWKIFFSFDTIRDIEMRDR